MEPGFYRGDILFLNMGHKPVRVGEVVVFNLDNRDIPIVHRVIKVHETEPGGEIKILTKVQYKRLCICANNAMHLSTFACLCNKRNL